MQIDQFNQNHNEALKLDIQIIPLEEYYYLKFKGQVNQNYSQLLINQTFVLFVLQLRTGMTQRSIDVLKDCILSFCQQALQKGLNCFGFVINGQYFTIKKPNYQAIKEILNLNLKISKQDNYLVTLRKLKHIIQTQIYKYDKVFECIDMVFFTSYVQIDHSLGVKKRSYIDQLNEHEQQCYKEVDKIQQILKSSKLNYNSHIIGLEKIGQQAQNYSLADRDLFNYIHCRLGQATSLIIFIFLQKSFYELTICQSFNQQMHASYKKLIEGFKSIASLILATSLSLKIQVPIYRNKQKELNKQTDANIRKQYELLQQRKQKFQDLETQKQNKKQIQQYLTIHLYTDDCKKFKPSTDCLIKKQLISLDKIYNNEVKLKSFGLEERLKESNLKIYNVQEIEKLYKISSSYYEPTSVLQKIQYKFHEYNYQLITICQQLKQEIISFKRIYDGNNKSHLQMKVNQEKQQYLRDKIFYIQRQAKQMYQTIFDSQKFPISTQVQCRKKRKAFELYSSLKRKLDTSQQVLMNIFKRQIKNDQIGKICQAVTYWTIRNSLKNKLVRRVNLNPKMLDQTYAKIHEIVKQTDYTSLDVQNKLAKHAIGNCIKSNINFATALRKQDCLAVLIQIQRPDSAIADPGRIKIRQISPFSISVANFFKIYQYGIDSFGQLNDEKGGEWIRQYAKLQKDNYKQMWDYWALVQKKYTVTALMPVYLCKQHWQVAKLLMKPCLGWTATGQPLGYTFSQSQTIPFMVLSFAIRRVQQLTYQIEQLQQKFLKNQFKVTQYSLLERDILNKNLLKKRMKDLCWVLQQTCFQIMKDMSGQNFQEKLSEIVVQKYINYIQNPLQRTIDIISNNSAFLSQMYCVIKLQIFKKPSENQFHQFFKRLIQQQLRRQTDGWNEQETQDKFINKLLNSEVQKMETPEFIMLDSEYYDKFQQLKKGQIVHKTFFQITRNELQMMITKNGKFNDTQRMMLIQYKRLYQNKVLWIWFIRFKLYQQIQRVKIYKWKSLDLLNSYMLFTMIIQNKKQRKNYKRREAIMKNEYVDPFNQQQARQYLQIQFLRLRGNKQKENIQILNNKKYGNAASTFVYTKSLQQAAGTLINFDIGQHCKTYFRQMVGGDGTRMQQKLRMLLLGQYKGVQMFRGWKMSKKKTTHMRKKYPELYMKYGYMF